jgi:putative oxidoreductase
MTSAAAPVAHRRSLTVVTWIGRALLALVFVNAGLSKLFGQPVMVEMFDLIGAGQWLRYVVGSLEVAGAVGVLVPRLSALAATGLVLLMVGATVTNLTVLHAPPWSPLVLVVVAALVAWAGWRRILSPAPAANRPLPSTL